MATVWQILLRYFSGALVTPRLSLLIETVSNDRSSDILRILWWGSVWWKPKFHTTLEKRCGVLLEPHHRRLFCPKTVGLTRVVGPFTFSSINGKKFENLQRERNLPWFHRNRYVGWLMCKDSWYSESLPIPLKTFRNWSGIRVASEFSGTPPPDIFPTWRTCYLFAAWLPKRHCPSPWVNKMSLPTQRSKHGITARNAPDTGKRLLP